MSPGQVVAGGSMVVGTVYARNYMGDYRALGWANVTATDGHIVLRARTTSDGRYQLFLSTGSWELITSMPGYKPVSKVIAVPDGGTVTYDFYLEESGVPIPEFHEYAAPFITSICLLLAVLVLRRRSLSTQRLS
ncbi:MAG: carboxypeptidase-like regulatory domain-containing protein [Candidatus Bathyarchaeia archaeon]